MAEDLSDIIKPMEFHPCDTPRGMLYYDMEILTQLQQTKLNTLKIDTLRENQKYLAAHPEIRACVAIISRLVMRQRPRTNIHETISEYFSKSRVDIENDVNEYLEQRKNYSTEGVSALNLCRSERESSSSSESTARDVSRGTLLEFRQVSSQHESQFWRSGISEITTATLQQPESLRNVGSDFDKMMKSASASDQSGSEMSADQAMLPRKMATHISEYLTPTKVNRRNVNTNANATYHGHVPTIEDYDAGYSKQRKTYVSNTDQNFKSEIHDILLEKQSPASAEHIEVQLEPCHQQSDMDVESTPPEVVSEMYPPGIRDSAELQSLMEKTKSGLSSSVLQRLDGDFRDMPNKMGGKASKASSFSKPSHRKSSSKSHIDADDNIKEKPDRTISFHIKKASSTEKPRPSVTKFSEDNEAVRKESGELKSRLKKTNED